MIIDADHCLWIMMMNFAKVWMDDYKRFFYMHRYHWQTILVQN